MRKIILIFILGVIHLNAFGQAVKVYEIKQNGARGVLNRTEIYRNNQLIQLNQFDEERQLNFVIKKTYNTQNQLVKEVKTFKKGHEYDLITEYYYDSEGRKSGILRGNNLTGKWYSEGYSYNPQNDVDTIFYYQKNGDLTKIRVFQYEYDNQSRKTKMTRTDIDLEMDEELSQSSFFYEYNGQGFSQKTIEKDENGTTNFMELLTNTSFDKPKTIILELKGVPTMKTDYSYNSRQKLLRTIDYENGTRTMTTTYKYNSRGKKIEERFKTKSGYGGEIYVYE